MTTSSVRLGASEQNATALLRWLSLWKRSVLTGVKLTDGTLFADDEEELGDRSNILVSLGGLC